MSDPQSMAILPPDQWRYVDTTVWSEKACDFLADDHNSEFDNAQLLIGGTYRPESFTIAERSSEPLWLGEYERSFTPWLTSLVTRRLSVLELPQPETAITHVVAEVMRVFEYSYGGHTVAEQLWNQEISYLIDRIAEHCLFRDRLQIIDHYRQHRATAHTLLSALLSKYGETLLTRWTPRELLALTTAAGLIGLDSKPGPAAPHTIPLTATPATIWEQLTTKAEEGFTLSGLDELFTTLREHACCEIVWFCDDLIETAFDLLTIQTLLSLFPSHRIHCVAKRGYYDNDASYTDVEQLTRLPIFEPLRGFHAQKRFTIERHGPRIATAHPLKFSPSLAQRVNHADLIIVKGGRVHEMLMGNLHAPITTMEVVVREFTESQTGLNTHAAPPVLFTAEPGEFPWWGWRTRAQRTLRLDSGRTIPACWHTVHEHHRHRTAASHELPAFLGELLSRWNDVPEQHMNHALTELRLLRDRIAQQIPNPREDTTHLIQQADKHLQKEGADDYRC